jgi:hypothetical protein
LNKQFSDLADRIDVTSYRNENLITWIQTEPIEKALIRLYTTVGGSFARVQYQRLKSATGALIRKQEDTHDEWYQYFEHYIKTRAGNKIVSFSVESRKQALKIIRAILEISVTEGWSAEQTAREIRKALVKDGITINQWRALRIARTEVIAASNQGAMIGARAVDVPLQKYWIPTYDERTRDTHLPMEQQNPKEMDEAFLVGGVWPAECPGDPDLPAEEVINCRCTISFLVKEEVI